MELKERAIISGVLVCGTVMHDYGTRGGMLTAVPLF
jgi:hypothetical protein